MDTDGGHHLLRHDVQSRSSGANHVPFSREHITARSQVKADPVAGDGCPAWHMLKASLQTA